MSTRREDVTQLVKQGLTYREIAKKLGIKSTNTIAYYANNVHQHRLVSCENPIVFLCVKCPERFTPIKMRLEE